jgi:hypothetical protein
VASNGALWSGLGKEQVQQIHARIARRAMRSRPIRVNPFEHRDRKRREQREVDRARL